jgi:hypothetical protein
VFTLRVYSACLRCVFTLLVYSECLRCVFTLRVYSACLRCVFTLLVYSACLLRVLRGFGGRDFPCSGSKNQTWKKLDTNLSPTVNERHYSPEDSAVCYTAGSNGIFFIDIYCGNIRLTV